MPEPTLSPESLARFNRLEMVARLVVEGFVNGLHKSPYKGFSVEFAEHRQYYPGDEIRHIDWRAYGKSDRYYVKEYEEETNLRAYLLVDASGSMAYAGRHTPKLQYAKSLAAALAYLMIQQQDAVGLMTFDRQLRQYIPPRAHPSHFHYLAEALDQTEAGGETALSEIFNDFAPRIHRRGLIIIISDCFDDLDALLTAIRHFRHRHHEVLIFHVLAPEEREFPFDQWTQFRNLERDHHRLLVDSRRLREEYLERFRHFCRDLAFRTGQMHVDYQPMITSDPYDLALGAYLARRAAQR